MGGLGVPVLWEGVAGFDRSCSGAVVSFPGDLRGNPEPDCRAGACFQAIFEHFARELLC